MNGNLKKFFKVGGSIFITGGLLIGAYALANSHILEKTNDVNPPYGRLTIQGATEINNINYIDRTSATVEIYAVDDFSKGGDIKYYVSTTPISNTEKIDDNLWKSYYDGVTETLPLPSLSTTNTIYAAFKDKAGNTSTIYTGENTEYTITYDANGGTNAPKAQTVQFGMPFYISSERPKREGKLFVGWSEVKGSTDADYDGVEIYYQNTKISANSLSTNKNITLYAVWEDDVTELPLLAEKVKVGDYVNYPVYYDNVTTYNGEYIASLTGWRVLSISGDTVNLVSAGVPLTYYTISNIAKDIKNLCINFLDIPFSSTDNNTFRKNGFTPYLTLKEVFDNKFTARYKEDTVISYTSTYNDGTTVVTYSGEKKAGDLKVRSMTKEDLDKVYDPTGETVTANGTYVTNAKYAKLLALPCQDKTSSYARYWLASAWSSGALRSVTNVMSVGDQKARGVRPVVSLKPEVKTTGTNIVGAWDILIED